MDAGFSIFDAHLDLAMNVRAGRDVRRPAAEQPAIGNEIATVGLPDLRAGRVTHVCPTIFCAPESDSPVGYRTPDEAFARAMEQLSIYYDWQQQGLMQAWPAPASDDYTVGLILLEGADPIRTPDDVPTFVKAGVRIVGLAWHATRYAGGTGEPGPLTPAGRELVLTLDEHNLIHDTSHLAEQSFWDLLELTEGPIIASHSNARSLVGIDPGQRHLSDEMIRALIARDAVIGINFFDKFLLPHSQRGKRRAALDDVVAHIRHVCDLAGDARHVGIGTDMDGGLGRDQIPQEIHTSAELQKLPAALSPYFSTDEIRQILHGNWFDFFTRNVPSCA